MTDTTTKHMREARKRHGRAGFVGSIEGHCLNGACAFRQVTGWLKEYEDKVPAVLHCPGCQQPLTVDRVETAREHHARTDQEARASVNAQIFMRDQPGGLKVIPLSVLNDESLPTSESIERLAREGRGGAR